MTQFGEPVSEIGDGSVVEQNLRRNFPHHEIAIPFKGSEHIFGDNFSNITKKVSEMPDTFGLCGVLAMHANGLLSNRSQWLDVNYDPEELKLKFDKWWQTRLGDSAWMWFDKLYGNRLRGGPNDFAILRPTQIEKIRPALSGLKTRIFYSNQWKEALKVQDANRFETNVSKKLDLVAINTPKLSTIFNQFKTDEGMAIAVLCEYPIQKGTHTHWLTARKQPSSDKLLITGDLKPFGIQAVGITVPYEETLQAMDQVIGANPTTKLTSVLAESESGNMGRNLHDNKMFLINFVRRKF